MQLTPSDTNLPRDLFSNKGIRLEADPLRRKSIGGCSIKKLNHADLEGLATPISLNSGWAFLQLPFTSSRKTSLPCNLQSKKKFERQHYVPIGTNGNTYILYEQIYILKDYGPCPTYIRIFSLEELNLEEGLQHLQKFIMRREGDAFDLSTNHLTRTQKNLINFHLQHPHAEKILQQIREKSDIFNENTVRVAFDKDFIAIINEEGETTLEIYKLNDTEQPYIVVEIGLGIFERHLAFMQNFLIIASSAIHYVNLNTGIYTPMEDHLGPHTSLVCSEDLMMTSSEQGLNVWQKTGDTLNFLFTATSNES